MHLNKYIHFSGSVVITATILWFAFDMIKYGAFEIVHYINAIVNASSIEPHEKCITQNENVTNTHSLTHMHWSAGKRTKRAPKSRCFWCLWTRSRFIQSTETTVYGNVHVCGVHWLRFFFFSVSYSVALLVCSVHLLIVLIGWLDVREHVLCSIEQFSQVCLDFNIAST